MPEEWYDLIDEWHKSDSNLTLEDYLQLDDINYTRLLWDIRDVTLTDDEVYEISKNMANKFKTIEAFEKAKQAFIDLDYTEEEAEQLAGGAVAFVSVSEPQITVEESVSILNATMNAFLDTHDKMQKEVDDQVESNTNY